MPRRSGVAGQPGVLTRRELVEADIGGLARGRLRQRAVARGAGQAERLGRLAGDGRQPGKSDVDGGTGGVGRQHGVVRPCVADASKLELGIRPRGERAELGLVAAIQRVGVRERPAEVVERVADRRLELSPRRFGRRDAGRGLRGLEGPLVVGKVAGQAAAFVVQRREGRRRQEVAWLGGKVRRPDA